MLSLSTSNKVTFNVNVSGTAAIPSVRCLIGEHPALSFPATKLLNDEWEVIIDLPIGMRAGSHPFKVEVLLNGRLFTPINYSIDVSPDDAVAVMPAMPEPAVEVPAQSNLMSAISKITEPEPTPNVPVSECDHEPDASAQDAPVKPEPAPKKKLGGLEKLAKTPVFSKPKVVEVKQIKISMLDIANEVNRNAVPVSTKSKPIQEARVQLIPVSLIKGTVIYR